MFPVADMEGLTPPPAKSWLSLFSPPYKKNMNGHRGQYCLVMLIGGMFLCLENRKRKQKRIQCNLDLFISEISNIEYIQ